MKQLYLDIKTKLSTITTPSLYIDLLTNQLSNVASIPSLPCAFIDFPYTYYKSSSAGVQLGNCLIRVCLGFSPASISGTNATNVLDLKKLVYAKLQGMAIASTDYAANNGSNYTPLTRGGERTETKYTDIYLFELDFYTTLQDTGVYTKKDYSEVNPWNLNLDKNPTTGVDLKIDNTIIRTGKLD